MKYVALVSERNTKHWHKLVEDHPSKKAFKQSIRSKDLDIKHGYIFTEIQFENYMKGYLDDWLEERQSKRNMKAKARRAKKGGNKNDK